MKHEHIIHKVYEAASGFSLHRHEFALHHLIDNPKDMVLNEDVAAFCLIWSPFHWGDKLISQLFKFVQEFVIDKVYLLKRVLRRTAW